MVDTDHSQFMQILYAALRNPMWLKSMYKKMVDASSRSAMPKAFEDVSRSARKRESSPGFTETGVY